MTRFSFKTTALRLFIIVVVAVFVSLSTATSHAQQNISIVTTTTQITDLLKILTDGSEGYTVTGLMGPGVDPHLFIASAGNVSTLANADAIFYNGLDLEGKMSEIFARMTDLGIPTHAITAAVDEETLIDNENFADNFDPHIWFDIDNWQGVTVFVRDSLSEQFPDDAALFEANAEQYLAALTDLKNELLPQVDQLPEARRVLVTSHDAFNYFGRAFGFEVRGIQGANTSSEAGVSDIQDLADFIVERQLCAIFTESSVSPQTIEALRAAVQDRGFNVEIGGVIFSDAMGDPTTEEGTYLGMMRHNVSTIVDALSEC